MARDFDSACCVCREPCQSMMRVIKLHEDCNTRPSHKVWARVLKILTK
jgi:hypothetical protein